MLPSKNRLKKKKDFERVFKKGKGFKEGFLFLKIAKNNLKVNRFGFVVAKKFSKKAVLRNRVKRRLREALKMKLPKIKRGYDGVLVVAKGLGNKDFQEIEKIVDKLFRKAGIIKDKL